MTLLVLTQLISNLDTQNAIQLSDKTPITLSTMNVYYY